MFCVIFLFGFISSLLVIVFKRERVGWVLVLLHHELSADLEE